MSGRDSAEELEFGSRRINLDSQKSPKVKLRSFSTVHFEVETTGNGMFHLKAKNLATNLVVSKDYIDELIAVLNKVKEELE